MTCPIWHEVLRRLHGRWFQLLSWKIGALLPVFTTIGCMVGPNYCPPAISVESAWSEAPRQIRSAAAEPRAGAWWKAFKDPELDLLIGRAVQANLDLEAAQARIREARATVKIQAAPLWPELDATESYTRSWQSQNAIQNPGGSTVENLAIGGQPGNLYEPGFDANWEIDVFGGTRRSVEAAQASLEASVYDRDDVLLTLLGDVASYYIDVRNYQIQMEVTRKNLAAQISTLNLTRARFEAGWQPIWTWRSRRPKCGRPRARYLLWTLLTARAFIAWGCCWAMSRARFHLNSPPPNRLHLRHRNFLQIHNDPAKGPAESILHRSSQRW